MDAQLNALPTLPAVSRTEGSGDHCSEHPRDRKKPWKNRDISESDYCKTNSLMDRIPAPLLEKPRENRPKSRFFTEVAAAEDVHCSGLETLAEQSSLATRHFRFSVASTADPDDSPRSCSTFREGGLEGRREWNPNRPVSEFEDVSLLAA